MNDIKAAIEGLLEPVMKENIIGTLEVRDIFRASGIGTVAGCFVKSGEVRRNMNVRLVRDGVMIYDGKIASLRRFKEDAREVQTGFECGVGLEKYSDIKPDDILEVYEVVEAPRELKDDST